ncbi:hypothetical protein LEBR102806_10805 [Levilactobacillus brevis]|nr:Uncharacterised protein [Levilactobacillus brevis]
MKKQYVIVALGLSLGLFFRNISVSNISDFARTNKRDADHHWPTSRLLLLSILLFEVVAIPTQ